MALIAGARLAIVAIFLLLGVLTFVSEVIFFKVNRPRRWRIPLVQLWIPIFIVIVGIILISITFAGVKENPYDIVNQCPTEVDADIGGDGVRVAVWVQIVSLLLISILSSFHTSATGIKEIGAGLILTHLSLSIAMLVQLRQDTLSFADAAIGTMILDAQNMALSIQLGSKDTLASRWQVGVTTITQAFGLVVEAILISRFTSGTSLVTDQCKCLTFFWWSWISNCANLPSQAAILWTYYACHLVASLQSNFHAIWNTRSFDRAERGERNSNSCLEDRLLKGITYLHISDHGDAIFNEYPATVSFIFGFYGLFALTSMITAENTMSRYGLRPSSQISSVGQIIALVIAGASIARAIWLLWRLFAGEKGNAFTWWPFSLGPAKMSAGIRWQIPSFDEFLPGSRIRLGNLFTDASNLGPRSLLDEATNPPQVQKDPEGDVSITVRRQKFQGIFSRISSIGYMNSTSIEQQCSAQEVELQYFDPSQKYIRERLESLRKKHPLLESESRCVYMVVQRRVAQRIVYEERRTRLRTSQRNFLNFSAVPEEHDPVREITTEYANHEMVISLRLLKIMLPRQRDGDFRTSSMPISFN